MLVFAIHQHESATGIHMSPLSWASLPTQTPSYLSRLSQSTRLSSLCQTADSHWLCILHMVMYMFPCYCLNSSHPCPPTLYPQVSALCLYLYCCPANRFINTIFLDSISQFSCSVVSDSLQIWIAACQASLSIINFRSSLRLTSIESVMPSSHLILCCPLLLLPAIPPSIRVFSNE